MAESAASNNNQPALYTFVKATDIALVKKSLDLAGLLPLVSSINLSGSVLTIGTLIRLDDKQLQLLYSAISSLPPKDNKKPPATDNNFEYVKQVNIDQFKAELSQAGLLPLIQSMDVTNNVISITTIQGLTDAQRNALRTAVVVHVPVSALEVKVQARISSAMDFGKQLMIEYATKNVLRGISVEQVRLLTIKFASIQLLLTNGSMYTALDEIQKLTPDNWLTQSDINYFVKKIKDYLGMP